MNELDLVLSQRYFHFISLKGKRNLLSKDFFKRWNLKESLKEEIGTNCFLYRLSMTSNTQFYKGEIDNSVKKDNEPPFLYDIILVEFVSLNMLIVGFPFKIMTISMVNSMVSEFNILRDSNFLKFEIGKILQANERHTDIYYNENHFLLGGVYLSMSGDNFISSVKLVGPKPLDSDIYKEYFKERLVEHKFRLDKCILRCNSAIKINSSLQIDKFGNYKMYIHKKGDSFFIFPIIFEFLNSIDCIIETPKNPVNHILDED